MRDTYPRYAAIKRSRMQCSQPRPTGQRERHLNPLVALIWGLTGGHPAQLSTSAEPAPSAGADQERLITRSPAAAEGGGAAMPQRRHGASARRVTSGATGLAHGSTGRSGQPPSKLGGSRRGAARSGHQQGRAARSPGSVSQARAACDLLF
jgi:hypothetical protein